MPYRNRVLPTGEIISHPARGTLTGNRGILVNADGRMTNRQWAAKAWITCVLEFRGRRRKIAQPRTWTELFFLDEAVAFAAGHRPCAYCRRPDYTRFKAAFPGDLKAMEMDVVLHAERVQGRVKRLHPVPLQELPNGAFVDLDGVPHLVWDDALHPFSPGGYEAPLPRHSGPALSLTPPSLLAVLHTGYRPAVHSSAFRQVSSFD